MLNFKENRARCVMKEDRAKILLNNARNLMIKFSNRSQLAAKAKNLEGFLLNRKLLQPCTSFQYSLAIGDPILSHKRAEPNFFSFRFLSRLLFTKKLLTDSNQSLYLCDNIRFVSRRPKEKEKILISIINQSPN